MEINQHNGSLLGYQEWLGKGRPFQHGPGSCSQKYKAAANKPSPWKPSASQMFQNALIRKKMQGRIGGGILVGKAEVEQ